MAFRERGGVTCCWECQDRHPACHDSCEKYQTEKAEYAQQVADIRKERYKNWNAERFAVENIVKTKKRGRIRSSNNSMANHKSYEKGN